MKKLLHVQRSDTPHWVGDGFPVRSIFGYQDLGPAISPFLLMDYAGPAEFPPSPNKRGVGEHPHRGFETVTIVYSGEVEHRDSAGGGGVIQAGDVQWMTAASGLVHEEFHGPNFRQNGGRFEMVQLWVNLRKKDKMSSPRYQGIRKEEIPVIELPHGAGSLRVIAGEQRGAQGPAKTFSPVQLWDLTLNPGTELDLNLIPSHTACVFVMDGELKTEDSQILGPAEIGVFEQSGTQLRLAITKPTRALFLGGEPLGEPVIGYGPFVMNSPAEIRQAMLDYEAGKMGQLGGGAKL